MNNVVRMQEVEVINLKNVKHGTASFQSYNRLRNKIEVNSIDGADILGIYGQNGSGKTALVESIDILRTILSGEEIDDNVKNLLSCNSESSIFKYIFKVRISENEYFVYYNFELRINKDTENLEISKETLKYSEISKDKKLISKTIIDYDINNEKNLIFKPLKIYKSIIEADEDNKTDLIVSREFAKENSTSFIFNNRTMSIFEKSFINNKLYIDIISSLEGFARMDLFVIKNDYLSHINLNTIMPFSFRIKNNKLNASGRVIVELFKPSIIQKDVYNLLEKVVSQINIVLKSIIPGLTIGVKTIKEELLENGEVGTTIELLSIRDDAKIPLKFESDGIKKIISILSALIAMYNNEKVCLVVDELDAGIFEFLLGELLDILKSNAKGQLIFTSHNLRPLEVLNKNDVIFTTVNPENRYIRLKNVKSTNNLRDFYLRGIFLGGQNEPIYKKTKSYEINRAFRKAGNLDGKK